MVPVGLMWGNDPTLNQAAFDSGKRATESVIMTDKVQGHPLKLGWLRRLNGPVDNPISSCLSCHSTAQFENDHENDAAGRTNRRGPWSGSKI